MTHSTTYGGFDKVIGQLDGRRDPLVFGVGEALPRVDADLAPFKSRLIGKTPEPYASSKSSFAYKVRESHEEFRGRPELLSLHGLLIANLRRRHQPPHCAALFQRLWAEEAAFLLAELNTRWLVSAITTFGDHGATAPQRRVGMALNVLFNTMKLYETERLYSGAAPDEPFSGRAQKDPLPMEMEAYAIVSGGLDVNMLGNLWQQAEEDDVIRPLAHHLLDRLDADPRSVFRRLRLMREAKERKRAADPFVINSLPGDANVTPVPARRVKTDPAAIRWGVVATIRAPLDRIMDFAAWHLSEGAARLHLYLDDADATKAAALAADPRIDVTLCDAAYWERQRHSRPERLEKRQVRNASQAYRRTDVDWLAHLDVDEFLLSPGPLTEILAKVPANIAELRLKPAELLSGGQRHFKLAARFANQPDAVLEDIYPTFGIHLPGGYLAHLQGKPVVRTGLPDCRLGIHFLKHKGRVSQNRAELSGGWVGHAHVADWDDFREKLESRLKRGVYRKEEEGFRLGDMLGFLRESEGETGLRMFYDEVCADTPALRDRLAAHGMLVTRDLDLARRRAEVFGALEPSS